MAQIPFGAKYILLVSLLLPFFDTRCHRQMIHGKQSSEVVSLSILLKFSSIFQYLGFFDVAASVVEEGPPVIKKEWWI